MINRIYFCSARKMYGDGSASYSSVDFSFSYKSFLPKGHDVVKKSMEIVAIQLEKYPGTNIEIISLNRI